jgi:hypothetical protein
MKEINTRIAIAANAFTNLTNIWKSKDLITHTKIKLFRYCVIRCLHPVAQRSLTHNDYRIQPVAFGPTHPNSASAAVFFLARARNRVLASR